MMINLKKRIYKMLIRKVFCFRGMIYGGNISMILMNVFLLNV